MKIICIPGFLGGQQEKNYQRIFETLGADEVVFVKPGVDWKPSTLKKEVYKQIFLAGNDEVIVIGISEGARIASEFTGEYKVKTYGFCPCPSYYYWAKRSWFSDLMRPLVRAIVGILMLLAMPFRCHCWWPLFGGTKPDGHFLSIYAILSQLWHFLDGSSGYHLDGAVVSMYDAVVNNNAVEEITECVQVADPISKGGKPGPRHADCRPDNAGFGGKKLKGSSEKNSSAESYARAFEELNAVS